MDVYAGSGRGDRVLGGCARSARSNLFLERRAWYRKGRVCAKGVQKGAKDVCKGCVQKGVCKRCAKGVQRMCAKGVQKVGKRCAKGVQKVCKRVGAKVCKGCVQKGVCKGVQRCAKVCKRCAKDVRKRCAKVCKRGAGLFAHSKVWEVEEVLGWQSLELE